MGMYRVVYKEETPNITVERTVLRSAVLEDCFRLIANHLNSHVPQFRKLAEHYVILDQNDTEVSEAA